MGFAVAVYSALAMSEAADSRAADKMERNSSVTRMVFFFN